MEYGEQVADRFRGPFGHGRYQIWKFLRDDVWLRPNDGSSRQGCSHLVS